jgi:hypothetical protein
MTMDVTERNTGILKRVIGELCSAKNIFQGDGPAMAFFQTPSIPPKRFVYVAFIMGGIKEEGAPAPGAATFNEVLESSASAFDAWLQPNRTLVWRTRPEAERNGDLWYVYWRCVQIDDDARSIAIDWHF